MKGIVKYSVLVILITLMAWGCNRAPTFPLEPSITYENIFFKKKVNTDGEDTLFLSINFKDGDGDLGLDANNTQDKQKPYHSFSYYRKDDGTFLSYADRNTPPFDTLPEYSYPNYCFYYVIEESDTFYIQKNPNQYNIFVEYYVRKNGEFKFFDWITDVSSTDCGESYNGRFPILNTTRQNRPLEGILSYRMKGARLESIFKRDTLKLRVYIQDRALNKSNVIETPEFVLKDITIN